MHHPILLLVSHAFYCNTPCLLLQRYRYCDKRFEHLDTLLRHVLFHLNEKEYACNHCDERFHRKQGVTNHIVRIHHKSQKYHCKKKSCSKRFATPERMHQHYTLVHQNKVDSSECPVCGSVYRQRRNMLQHMNNAHEESDAAMFLKRVEV